MNESVTITLEWKHLIWLYAAYHIIFTLSMYYTVLYRAKQQVKRDNANSTRSIQFNRAAMVGTAVAASFVPAVFLLSWILWFCEFTVSNLGRPVSLIMFGDLKPLWNTEYPLGPDLKGAVRAATRRL